MAKKKINTQQLEENLAKLPSTCMAVLEPENVIIFLERNMSGYKPLKKDSYLNNPVLRKGETLLEYVDRKNARFNCTSQQRMAMMYGSMFGFDQAHANPDNWNLDGTLMLDVIEEGKAA